MEQQQKITRRVRKQREIEEELGHGIAPGILDFAYHFKDSVGAIHTAAAETVAESFRRYFDLPVPMNAEHITKLIRRVDMRRVFFKPDIEHMYAMRGIWAGSEAYQMLLVESNRPEASRCKTVLHELIEPLWVCEMELNRRPYTLRERETWANRFAAMVKMPPEMFMDRAAELGCDLRDLAGVFEDTLAGVSRQIRDINLSGRFFYFCRFDLANVPEDADEQFRRAHEECGGICVRIVDVAKTFRVHSRREKASFSVPMYNLPGKFHYRILNGEMRRYLTENKPVYITGYDAASSFNDRFRDLFAMNRISVLIHRYGNAERSGFFMVAVAETEKALEPQLDRIEAIRRNDIDWLFRLEDFIKQKVRMDPKSNPNYQRGLPMIYSRGREKDMSELEYQWTGT